MWNLHTGTVEHTFKGGTSTHNSLNVLNSDFLVSAGHGKPILHVWPLCKKVRTKSQCTHHDFMQNYLALILLGMFYDW